MNTDQIFFSFGLPAFLVVMAFTAVWLQGRSVRRFDRELAAEKSEPPQT